MDQSVPTESPRTPETAEICFRYSGASMHPTLRASDTIRIVPNGTRRIRSGDVVVFPRPGDGCLVVHRVVSAGPEGITTRGDNNLAKDPWVLSADMITGCVTSVMRGKRCRRIPEGLAGRLRTVPIRIRRRVSSWVSSLLCPAYHVLARNRSFRRFLAGRFAGRVFLFDCRGKKELRLMIGRRVAGRMLQERNRWQIRRPYRLFCDPSSLPQLPSIDRHEIP